MFPLPLPSKALIVWNITQQMISLLLFRFSYHRSSHAGSYSPGTICSYCLCEPHHIVTSNALQYGLLVPSVTPHYSGIPTLSFDSVDLPSQWPQPQVIVHNPSRRYFLQTQLRSEGPFLKILSIFLYLPIHYIVISHFLLSINPPFFFFSLSALTS